MIIARSQDMYNRQCVFTSNKILAALWEVKDIKRQLKSMVSLGLKHYLGKDSTFECKNPSNIIHIYVSRQLSRVPATVTCPSNCHVSNSPRAGTFPFTLDCKTWTDLTVWSMMRPGISSGFLVTIKLHLQSSSKVLIQLSTLIPWVSCMSLSVTSHFCTFCCFCDSI